jgi:N-acyl-phosphatidylethanolamine-hydrolysing phospholipase D
MVIYYKSEVFLVLKNLFLLLYIALSLFSCTAVKSTIHATGSNIAAIFQTPEIVENKMEDPIRPEAGLAVLWIGHATCLIQIDDKFVLTDPNLTTTVGQFSKRLVEPGIDPENLPNLDVVLISHMHIDHLSPGSLGMIEAKTGHLILPEQGLVYIPDLDFPMSELKTWQSREINGLKITAVPVIHNGWRYGADIGWMDKSYTGYIIEYNGKKVFFAGDTAYDSDLFKEIGRKYTGIDLVLAPIAPIHPREYSQARHMDPLEAIKIYQDMHARFLIPIHYDTFPESLDEKGEAVRLMKSALQNNNLTGEQVHILDIGAQVVLLRGDSLIVSDFDVAN